MTKDSIVRFLVLVQMLAFHWNLAEWVTPVKLI
jgi:hypothetical protein